MRSWTLATTLAVVLAFAVALLGLDAAPALGAPARVAVLAAGLLLLGGGGAWLATRWHRALDSATREAERWREAAVAHRAEPVDLAGVDPELRPVLAPMVAALDACRLERRRLEEALATRDAAVQALVADARRIAQAVTEGRLEVRADVAGREGDLRDAAEAVNHMLEAVVRPLREVGEAIGALAGGSIPPPVIVDCSGDLARMRDDLNGAISALGLLAADADALAEAGAAGRLSSRVDDTRHRGDLRTIVEGFNRTLDAVVDPLNTAARAVAEIAAGRIPEPITSRYEGDLVRLQHNLNTCIEAVNRLVVDSAGLVQAAAEGQLGHRADVSRHEGDFARIIEGVNQTLDAVTDPIGDAAAVLDSMAARDLRVRMEGSYRGDHDRIRKAIDATADALQDAMRQVARSAEEVSDAASQIATSSQAVASGASEQAASLEEIHNTVAAVMDTTRADAQNAERADQLAGEARTAASAGTAAVEQLQGAMGKVRASSDRTGQIIKDVAEIAFQTNLLALNAAVEAARAGEAGRGFAVVAEEVRSLALRAKEASQKTEDLIRESVRQVGSGDEAAVQVSSRLGEIARSVDGVSAMVGEIAASARRQSARIEQVNAAVGQLDKVTQQNAASSEESSSAATELNAQAEELAAMIAGFRIDGPVEARRAPRTASAPLLAAVPSRPLAADTARTVTLQWWDYLKDNGNDRRAIEDLIGRYQASHPNVTIVRTSFAFGELKRKVVESCASHTVPDLVLLDNPDVQSLAAQGALADITDLVGKWNDRDQFLPGPWATTVHQGRNYGVPYKTNATALFYDAELLAEAGIRSPPANWGELRAAAKALTRGNRFGFCFCALGGEEGACVMLPLLWGAGGDLSTMGDAASVKMLAFLRALVVEDRTVPSLVTRLSPTDVSSLFSARKCAMMINGGWVVPAVARDARFRWSVAGWPHESQPVSILGGEDFAIGAGSHVREAWDFVTWAVQPANLVPALLTHANFPGRKDAAADPRFTADPIQATFLQAVSVARPRAYGPSYPKMSAEMMRAVHHVLAGTATPEQAAAHAGAAIAPLLARS